MKMRVRAPCSVRGRPPRLAWTDSSPRPSPRARVPSTSRSSWPASTMLRIVRRFIARPSDVEAQCPVDADYLAIEVVVIYDGQGQHRVLVGVPHPLGVGHPRAPLR